MGARWQLTFIINNRRYCFNYSYDGYFSTVGVEIILELKKLLSIDPTLRQITSHFTRNIPTLEDIQRNYTEEQIDEFEYERFSGDYSNPIIKTLTSRLLYTDENDDVENIFVINLDTRNFTMKDLILDQDEYEKFQTKLLERDIEIEQVVRNTLHGMFINHEIFLEYPNNKWRFKNSSDFTLSFDKLMN